MGNVRRHGVPRHGRAGQDRTGDGAAARRAGHDVVGTDLAAFAYGPVDSSAAPYLRADLTDVGQALNLIARTRDSELGPSFNQWTFADADDLGDLCVPVGDLERPNAGALSVAKARRLFGWEPRTGLAAR